MVIMSLQEVFDEREFDPLRNDRRKEASDFTVSTPAPEQDSFAARQQIAIAEARLQTEKIYMDIVHKAEADLL
jgi:hypothetical protein